MSASPPPRQLKAFPSIIASALAACTACVFTNPMETIKTRLQLDGEGAHRATHTRQYRGILHAFTTILRMEGPRGLQAGLWGALAYQLAMNGTRLGLYDPIQRGLRSATGADPASVLLKATSAACSGAIGATLGSPLYMIKSRLQAQRCVRHPPSPRRGNTPALTPHPSHCSPFFHVKEAHQYTGMVDGLRKVHAAEGVTGLFRGLNGALPRVMTGSAVQLSSYDTCKGLVAGWGVPAGIEQHLSASLVASVLTVTAMNPWDVISTRLYQSKGHGTQYSGPLDCAAKTVRVEGWAALQRGWLAQYGRLGPHTVLTFCFLEYLRPLFQSVDALCISS